MVDYKKIKTAKQLPVLNLPFGKFAVDTELIYK